MRDIETINERRFWLICKELNIELTEAEKQELAALDAEVDEAVDAVVCPTCHGTQFDDEGECEGECV